MATILTFEPRRDQIRHDAPAGPAKILLFTGIRYERLASPVPGRIAKGARKRALAGPSGKARG